MTGLRFLFAISLIHAGMDSAWASCPAETTDLVDSVNAANASFAMMDESGFTMALQEVRADLPCITEPITPIDAAALHRLEAFDAFMRQDESRALSAFHAALDIQPAFELPATIAPSGTPLDQVYEQARNLAASPLLPLRSPVGTQIVVDGALSNDRPLAHSSVIQLQEADGRISWSGYLWPSDPLPPEIVPGPPHETTGRPDDLPPRSTLPPSRFNQVSRTLFYGALASAAVATSFYAVAWSSHDSWYQSLSDCTSGGCTSDPVARSADITALRQRTNVATVVSAGTGAVATGLSLAALVTLRW